MSDEPDYDLLKTPDEAVADVPPPRPVGLWIVAAVLIAAMAIAAYVVFGRRHAPPPPAQTAGRAEAPTAVQPLGGAAASITVPPLDESDSLVRDMVRKLSAHPQVAAWLATKGLIRNFTVVVTNIAEGATPAVHLKVLRPSSSFGVNTQAGTLSVDPHSYDRYDGLAAAAASIDPAGAARLYATLKPRIEEAYRDLGFPDKPFDRALEQAIVRLLQTPIVEGPVPVTPRGATGYAFADARLEGLTAAQKQLLRMGPRNEQTVQSSLRAIALALGIPPERLPPPASGQVRQD